jgi:hypothetical protein
MEEKIKQLELQVAYLFQALITAYILPMDAWYEALEEEGLSVDQDLAEDPRC